MLHEDDMLVALMKFQSIAGATTAEQSVAFRAGFKAAEDKAQAAHDDLFNERSALREALFEALQFVPDNDNEARRAVKRALKPLGSHVGSETERCAEIAESMGGKHIADALRMGSVMMLTRS